MWTRRSSGFRPTCSKWLVLNRYLDSKPTHTYFEKKYDPASGTTKRMRFSHLSGVVMPIPAKPPAIPTTQAEGERDTSESLVKQVTFTPKMFEAPFPNALLNEIYRMARKGGEGRAL